MMIRKAVAVLACVCAASVSIVSLSCQPAQSSGDPVVRVGKVTIGQASFDAFRNKFARTYPSAYLYYFPGQRQAHTFMAESEAIWQYVKSDSLRQQVKSSPDWKWKEKYFKAGVFIELLGDNLGFTDAELMTHYKKDAESFRITRKTQEGHDTSYIRSFEDVKRMVADRVFYDKNKPDSAFMAQVEGHEHEHDEDMLRNHWLYHVRTNPLDFYMRLLHKERTGEVYDSLQQIYAEDGSKIIKPQDVEVIRLWLPEGRRDMMRLKDLVEWLYKWEIFSDYADKHGLTAGGSDYKDVIYWALRVEHAFAYLRSDVEPKFPVRSADPAVLGLAELIVYDNMGHASDPHPFRVQAEAEAIASRRAMAAADSMMYVIRRSVKIEWLQDDFRDDRSADPAALFKMADSLRDAAVSGDLDDAKAAELSAEAEKLFRAAATELVFAPEGRKAMTELAKMLIDKYAAGANPERYLLSQAVNFYRRAQELDTDAENLCNSYFMVGFTYDEHMKNYSLAEANYKWILRNTPACALASDAEFMILHLGEPMTSIEEIQSQSVRQGRKVEFDEDGDAES